MPDKSCGRRSARLTICERTSTSRRRQTDYDVGTWMRLSRVTRRMNGRSAKRPGQSPRHARGAQSVRLLVSFSSMRDVTIGIIKSISHTHLAPPGKYRRPCIPGKLCSLRRQLCISCLRPARIAHQSYTGKLCDTTRPLRCRPHSRTYIARTARKAHRLCSFRPSRCIYRLRESIGHRIGKGPNSYSLRRLPRIRCSRARTDLRIHS
jgi:hypothetical protein